MSSADDNSASSSGSRRRQTLVGIGVTQDRLDRLAQAVKDARPSGPPRPTLPALPPRLDTPGVDDSALLHAVDRAWEELHSEATDDGSDSLDELSIESLDEESLPEAIHEPTPTLEVFKVPAPPPTPYGGDNRSIQDFEAGRTELVASPYQSEPTVGRLVSLNGPAVGQEFFVTAPRNTVGRGTTNTIVIPDLSMSRQHFEVVRNPDDTFTLVDLLSINGTTLNGLQVKEAELRHGDRIDVGGSLFQFVVTGPRAAAEAPRHVILAESAFEQRAPVAPTATPSGNGRALAALALLVALVMTAAVATAVVVRQTRQPEVAPAPVASAESIYLAGVDAVKLRDWDLAQTKFAEVQQSDPMFDGLQAQLDRLNAERRALAQLNAARDELDRGNIPSAVRLLDEIPHDSAYGEDAELLGRDARRAEVLQLYGAAQEAFARDDHPTTRGLLEQVLDRVPTHVGAQELLARCDDASTEVEAGEALPEETAPAVEHAADVEPGNETANEPARPRPHPKKAAAKPAPKSGPDDWIAVEIPAKKDDAPTRHAEPVEIPVF